MAAKTGSVLKPHEGSEEESKSAVEQSVICIDPHSVLGPEGGVPELDEKSGVPKALKAYVVHENPEITVVPHFFTDNEIAHLLELSEKDWIPSVVGTGVYKTNDESKDLQNQASPNRTSFSCMLKSAQTPEVERMEHRLAKLAGMDVDHLERLNMVRYHPGQFFNRHHDGRFRPITVFVYLNDLDEDDGGETFFSEVGVKVRPRKGCAVMWANNLRPGVEDPKTFHYGLAPKKGIKYGVNCFFNDKPLRRWEADSDTSEAEEGVENSPTRNDSSEGKTSSSSSRRKKTWIEVDGNELLAQEGGGTPGKLRSFVVCKEPRVCVLPNFLSSEETSALLSCLSPPEDRLEGLLETLAGIEQRLAAVAGLPLVNMETLKVSKCEPHMRPDGQVLAQASYPQRFGQRVICIFLNDVPEGGEVRFPKLGFQVAAREACAVMWNVTNAQGEFDFRGAHQGQPPKAGTRYVALGVFRAEPVRVPAPATSQ
mmetsp:Transcript_23287/g.51136  ORF Transcript_23287/g.51136 Transcript_23287/m.51136 type:complete len:482 (-) Transcript_23287:554-1999(-)